MKYKKKYLSAALSLMLALTAGELAGCSSNEQVDPTPSPSVTVESSLFYENDSITEIVEITNEDGEVIENISISMIDGELDEAEVEDWYNNYVYPGIASKAFDYAVVVYDSDKLTEEDTKFNGVYADEKCVYVDVEMEQEEDKSITIPAKTEPTYEVDPDTGMITVDAAEDEEPDSTATPEATSEAKVSEDKTASNSSSSNNNTTNNNSSNNTKPNTSNSSSSSSNNSSNNTSNNTNSNSNSSNTKPSNSNSSSNNSSSSTHTHNWVQQYTTVHHDAVTRTVHHDAVTHTEQVWVQDSAAWDEQIVTGGYDVVICRACGQQFATIYDWGDHSDLTDHGNYTFQSIQTYSTVHHDATGHYETKTITDQAAYDETVVVTAAYDEQVANGYKCSSCGQTK